MKEKSCMLWRKVCAWLLAFATILGGINIPTQANAATKKLKTTAAVELSDQTDSLAESNQTAGSRLTELNDGDKFIMYNAGSKMVLTSTANGTRLTGVTASPSGDTLSTPDGAAVITTKKDANGYYTFVCDGKYLTTKSTGGTLTFEDKESDYSLWILEKTANSGEYYVKSAKAVYGTSSQYIEYYQGFTTFSYKEADAAIFAMSFYSPKESLKVADVTYNVAAWAGNAKYEDAQTSVYGDLYDTNDMLDEDAKYTAVVSGTAVQLFTVGGTDDNVIHYMGATGLGSGDNDYMQFELSSAGYADMAMTFRLRASKTGEAAFQVQYSTDGENFANFTTGAYSYSYTAYGSDGSQTSVSKEDKITDGIAKTNYVSGILTKYISFTFDVPEGAENADKLYIRLVPSGVKANDASSKPSDTGTTRIDSVVISGSPVVSDDRCGYVTSNPEAGEVAQNSEITLSSATAGVTIYYSLNNGEYKKYDEASKPVIDKLPATIRAYAVKDGIKDSIKTIFKYNAGSVATVQASPSGGSVLKNTEVKLSCKTEDAVILYSTDQVTWTEYKENIVLSSLPVTYYVKATKDGYEDSAVKTLSYTERKNEKYSLYFGQLHAHTNYSDGSGSCEEAYKHGTDVDNLDYLAITDHSNSFDNADSASIKDGSVSSEWVEGNALAQQYTTDTFVGLFGYEMTWSNGLGHMNTFNTDGFQSRTQTEFSTYSTALQNYYAALKTVPNSISQFNHPGTTFGDFSDFAHYDDELDNLITMIEVGNGEGAIGSSGYFPSYQYYQRALDKGWHVAPTNNQDNHKGLWGDANTARSVVMADSLTEENIYDAIRNYRVYATEDNDLSIYYTLDGHEMGSILTEGETGDTVKIKAELSDPTDSELGTIDVITNGGLILATKTVETNEAVVEFDIDNKYSYYYLKITEKDGDIAVTAPVWVGEVEAAGINSMSTSEVLPVQNEALDVSIELYNNEASAMTINSIEFKVDDEVVHTVDLEKEGLTAVDAMSTASYTFNYTYEKVGSMEIEAVVNATLNGAEKIYKSTLKLNYVVPEMVTKVVIDGSHYNDYVTGYYGANVGNFTTIAGSKNIRVETLENEADAEKMLEDCALFIVSAPAKKTGTANAGDYTISHFSDEFIQAVKAYTDKGGTFIACGIADYQDSTECQTTTEMNKLLTAIGATTQLNSDEAYDEENNGGQPYRLYLTNYNADSRYLNGAVEGQEYSAYSGCTVKLDETAVAAGKAEALITGFDSTYSINTKTDGVKADNSVVVEKGNMVALAHETLASGANIFVGGTVFISDFEVKAEMDNQFDLQYLNHTIVCNILDEVTVELPSTSIAEVRKGEMGEVYAIEGYITASRDLECNAFFDAVCVQDDTAGITVFPWNDTEYGKVELGTKVKVVGYVDAYQGEKELQVMSCKVLSDEEKNNYEPKEVSAKDAMDYDLNGGNLVKVTGVVTKITDKGSNGDNSVNQFYIDDGTGEANIFIDGYILSRKTGENTIGTFVKEGSTVSAVGLVYSHPATGSDDNEIVLRVRNCDEITLVEESVTPTTEPTTAPTVAPTTEPTTAPTVAPTTEPTTAPTVAPTTEPTVTPTTEPTTVPANKVTLNKSKITLNKGKTYTLKATVKPNNSTDTVTWSSSNKKVAKVTQKGKVTAVKKGTATITVKTSSGKKATCKVTVKVPANKVTLNKSKITLNKGKTYTLKATIKPNSSTDTVTWSSSNKKVAKVTQKGKVKAVKKGTAKITVKTSSGKKATCKVTVK